MDRNGSRQGELPFEDSKPTEQVKPKRVLRLPQVRALTGLGRSFIYKLQAENRFPKRIKLGERSVGWLEDEVQKWVSDRIAESRQGKANPS